ncbi:MAG: hypothetical protein DBX59_06565 [Bacillota bacterium]|nr:MAG: hypothetical protein DBX59_06565 [Bacillota bacterium]
MERKIIFEKNYYTAFNERSTPVETENFLLYQVGDGYYYNGLDIGAHEQYFDIELSIILYNSAYFYADGAGTELKKNDIYVSLKNELHQISAKNTFRYQYFAFDIRENSKFKKYLAGINARNVLPRKALQSREIIDLSGKIISEFMSAEVNADLLDCLLGQIVVGLYRGEEKNRALEINDKKQIALALRAYIDERFLTLNTLTELSAQYGYSYPYLSKVFSDVTGKSLKTYLLGKKMEYARHLLTEGASVTEAAETLSYSSIYNFSRAFKEYFGKNPETFKRK